MADMPTLTTANVVTFSVVATDPDGLDDLAGGSVVHPGGQTYGALQADGAPGSFKLPLSWPTVNSVSPIITEGTKAATRTFEIQIFDKAGNRATTTVAITLHCSGALSTACNGVCVSFYSDEADCGTTCDNHRACAAQETCERGVCTPAP
jgi:hypothetical protein